MTPLLLTVAGGLLAVAACDKQAAGPVDAGVAAAPAALESASSAAPDAATLAAPSDAATADAAAEAAKCPAGMQYVDTTYCSKVVRQCQEEEYDKVNHLPICHKYKEGETKCVGTTEHRQFCIDKYEYPNQEGAHPAWMLDWFQAQATCKSKGKRLCYASEWTAACEGPDHTPFPYGWVRDHDKCNFDNFYIGVKKAPGVGFVMFSKNKEEREAELSRLDQSVPSGAMPACKSGFGVHDLTGNLDEWVTSDEMPREKSKWAGFKGGAWGHVRNQCRPMTTSHEPHETYYFWSFRCCRDSEGDPAWTPNYGKGDSPAKPPDVEAHDFAPDPVVPVNPPGPSKTKFGPRGDRNYPAKN